MKFKFKETKVQIVMINLGQGVRIHLHQLPYKTELLQGIELYFHHLQQQKQHQHIVGLYSGPIKEAQILTSLVLQQLEQQINTKQ
jgi:hypothetical protein